MKEKSISLIIADNFQQEILEEKNPVLLLCSDYNSEFPNLFSILQNLTQTMKGGLKVGILAEDFTKPFQDSYRVIGTPTFLLFDQGRERGRLLGQTDLKTLTDWINGLHVLH